jgi:electron transport complex protein RnfC
MEDNKAHLIPMLEREIRILSDSGHFDGEITIGLCQTRYPQGGEKMLITALTGREVPSGGLPADVGCIVQNVSTLSAIAEAFTLGKPMIDRNMTISGGACKTPKNTRVPIGTIITELPPEFISIDTEKVQRIIFGGPMMGFAVPSVEIPVQKNNNGMIFMTAAETSAFSEGPCIRCSRCIHNCPMHLSPVLMNNALDAGDLDEAAGLGVMDCIECGSCSYMCPARIKLTQRFRVGKGRLKARPRPEAKPQAAK